MIELYDHQRTALNLLRLNDGFALFMEQGTGKTFPVLFRMAELAGQGRIESALIVAPKAVCESWRDKIRLLSDAQREQLACIELRIVSYDMVWRRTEYVDAVWDMVVLDESHYVKSPSAKRTKACQKICSMAYYRYILTGTPTSNGQLCNLWSQLSCVDPTVVRGHVYPKCLGGDSYYKWIERVAYMDPWHKPYKYKDVAALQDVMGDWSYRITKDECLDLPERLPDVILHCDLPGRTKKAYREMARHSAIVELDTLAGNSLTRSLRLRQLASGFLDTENGERVEYPNPKLVALRGLLTDWEGKVVVFCDFRHSIDAVSGLLDEMGIGHVILDGRQQDKGVWRRFQEDPEVRAIICQYQSGSAGIDLYAADTIVFFEPSLSSNLTEQARDRIHRIGQRHACSYYWLLVGGTIEHAIYKALLGYADFSDALFTRYIETYCRRERLL